MQLHRTHRAISLLGALALVMGMFGAAPRPAQAAATTHSYLVVARTARDTAAAQSVAQKAGGSVVQSWPQIGVLVVRSTRADFANRVRKQHSKAVLGVGDARGGMPATDRVQGKGSVTAQAAPARKGTSRPVTGADPMSRQQAYLAQVKAPAAQKITGGSSAVVVGVIDTGVDDRHPDLKANFSAADSVDCTAGGRPNTARYAWRGNDSHGTHVAGTIAAARNGVGITGIAPNVKVASIKVVDRDGLSYPDYLTCAYMWAAQRHLSVTNASINLFDLWCADLSLEPVTITAVQRAVAFATGRGVVHVQSAGNGADDTSWQLHTQCKDPLAGRSDVVHVTSLSPRGLVSGFASRGRGVADIAAPGENVLSDSTGSGYELRTGTSQAAPQVAGTIALMRSKRPSLTPAQAIARLRKSTVAVPVSRLGRGCTGTPRANTCTGSGSLDVLAAVKAA